jgi:hypothetical protein
MGFRSHSFESSRLVEDMVLATLAVLISAATPMDAQQIPDTAYTPPIASPHYECASRAQPAPMAEQSPPLIMPSRRQRGLDPQLAYAVQ